MDKINLNLFGLNYQTHVEKKDEKKAEEKDAPKAQTSDKNVEQGAVLDAMALSGAQNLAFQGINQINPKDYLDDLSLFQTAQLGFEASFDYSDNLTQIVSSIIYSEYIQNKQEILLEILNSVKIHVVPVSIFTMLESCLDSDHLKEIYENFQRRGVLFTSNLEDRVSGQVLEIRIADEDELSVIESLWHSKRYQK